MSITTTTAITAVADNKGTIQGNLSSGGVTDDTSLVLSGTISVALVTGQVVAVYDGATKLGNAAVSGTTWTYNDFTLANSDSVSYTAQVEDGVSQGPASAAFTTTIDNVPSTTTGDVTGVTDDFGSVTGSIAQGGSTDDHTPLISGTLSTSLVAGESVHIYRTLIGGAVVDAGVATVSGTTWSFSDTISTEGAYRYQARVLDAAGNVGSSDTAYNINVTVAAVAAPAPVVTGILGDTGQSATDGITNDTTLYITGTGIAGATVTVYKNAVSIGTTTADFLGRWQFDYTGTTLAQGTYNFTAQQTDLSGNGSPVSTAFTATIDTTAPTTTAIISTVEDDEGAIQGNLTSGDTTDDTSLVLTGTISAPLAAGEIVGIYDGGTRAGAQPVRLGTATMLDDSTWTFTDSTLGNGLAVSYTAQVEDVAGNGNASTAFTVTIDTTPPPVPTETVAITAVADNVGPVQGSLSSGGFTDDTSLDLSGTISSTLLAGEVVAVYDGATRLGNAVVSGTTWTYTDATLAGGDSVSYTVLVENAAGQGAASAAFTVNIDTTAPAAAATITSVTDDVVPVTGNVASGGFTNDSTPLIGGTLSASLIYGETVHVFRDGVDIGVANVSGTTWTFSDTLTDGSYSYTAQVQDIAGNVSALSAAYSITEVGTASVPVNPEPLTYINFDFSASLNAAFTPATTDFVGKLNAGSTFNPSAVSIAGNVLSLGVTAAATDIIEFNYTPGANPLQDNAGNLTGTLHLIAGGSNADTIDATYTTAGVDYVWGGDGNDTITGGAGADILYGDNGNDTFVYSTLTDFVTGGAVVDSITGGAGTDKIQVAGAISLATTDTLARVNTVEQLVAASSGSNLAHSIVLDTNAKLGSITAIDLSANTGASSTAAINMTGVTTAMTLTGVSAGVNTITGGDGNDTITGGSGNDSLSGGNGNDTFVFASMGSLLNVAHILTTYTSTPGPSDSYPLTPYYYNYASSGDVITGGAGTDKIQVAGAITINSGTTTYQGIPYGDSLASVSGVEQLVAASSSSNLAHSIVAYSNAQLGSIATIDLSANSGATSTGTINLTGVTTAMTLTGVSAGHNTITGGSGADTITGGSGADTLDGGSGNDIFVYATMADFVSSHAVVDSITGGAGTTDKVQVAGNITLTTADTLATRLVTVEQLVAASQSASALTHSIVLDTNAKLSSITGIDLSGDSNAGSTATIDLTGVTTSVGLIGVSAGTNVLTTGSGNDTIIGGSGNDTITSGTGNDNLSGGNGNDTFTFAAGTGLTSGDTVNGGAGTDTIVLTGNAAITATDFNNVSNVEIITLANTTANAAITTANALVAAGATLTLNASSLTTGTLTFNGAAETDGAFSIIGGAANDTITGGAGDDTIVGGLGNDSLSGGNGNDTFTFAAGTGLTSADTVNGGTGTDTVALTGNTAVAATDFNNVSNIEAITLQNTTTNVAITMVDALVASGATLTLNASSLTSGTLNFNGSAETNGVFSITGGAGADTITGGSGADTITGGSGADTLDGGSGNDTFVYATMADFVSSHAVVDSITGGAGTADKVQVAGNITLTTADTLATRLVTVEQLVAAPQSDSALTHSIVLDTNAKLSSITTIDLSGDSNAGSTATIDLTGVTTVAMTLTGVSAGTNTITGSAGANSITGGSGVDILNGGAGNDTINGGDGNDTITGGSGVDALNGGNGDDTFVYATMAEFITGGGAVIDTVTGGAGTDKIQVSGAMTLTTANTLARVNTVEQLVAASSASNLTHSIVVNTNAKLGSITTIDLSANTGATSTGTINLTGVTTAMTLTGVSAGHNTITGGSGLDTLTGGSGADTLDGGSGNDTFVYATMADFVSSHAVVDSITGGGGIDKVQVAGNITLTTADTLATRLGTVEQLVAASESATALAHSIVLDTNAKLSSITTIDLSGDSNTGSTATINLTGVTTNMTLKGVSAGSNTITSGTGNDSITGGSGNDTFNFIAGTGLTSADTVNGGTGNDTIALTGNTAIASTNFNNVSNVEIITLQNTTTNVAITTANALVASGATLTLDASSLTTGTLTFNGAAETNGAFNITAGVGNDNIIGGSGNDTFTFVAGTGLTSADTVNGSTGIDTVALTGNTAIISSNFNNVSNIEAITLQNTTNNVAITTANTLVASGATLTLNASGLTSGTLAFNGAADTNSYFSITGGAANDSITGGSLSDTLTGGAGVDVLDGGSGNDTFVYATMSDFYTGGAIVDSITGGAGTADKIQVSGAITLTSSDTLAARMATVEQLAAASESATALTHSIVMNSNANLGSITTIDLSGDTNVGSHATIDLTGVSTDMTISGTTGVDTLIGGSGSDTFIYNSSAAFFAAGTAVDAITGSGGTDKIQIAGGILINGSLARINTVEQLVAASQSAAALTYNIVINSDANLGSITTIDLSGDTNTGSVATVDLTGVTTGVTIKGVSAGTNHLTGGTTTSITGGSGNDTITGGTGNDSLSGGGGNDTFTFVAGTGLTSADTLDGGTGTDTVALTGNTAVAATNFNNVSNIEAITLQNTTTNVAITTVDALVASGATLTLNAASLTTGKLTFNGTAETDGAFNITGGAGNDTITGGAGNDTITGGAGVDVLSGGNGNDTFAFATMAAFYTGGAVVDSITGGSGTDAVQVAGAIILTTSDNLGTARLSSVEQLVAASSASTLTYSIVMNSNANLGSITTIDLSANTVASSTGVINMTGVTTGMTLTGVSAGANTITGSSGNDTITGGAVNDSLNGGLGNDSISGGNGNDTITFAAGTGLTSADTVNGGTGTDTVALTGNTAVTATDFNNVSNIEVITLANTTTNVAITTVDALVASGATLTLNASGLTSGTLTFNGGAETDGAFSIVGGAANDTITGGAGNDTLAGGTGSDSLSGGNGDDTFTFAAGTGLTSADTVNGGGGTDTVALTGNTATAATDFNNVSNIEAITLQNTTTNVAITTVDALVASGATLTLNASSSLIGGGTLNFNGAAETDGAFSITGGTGSDTITGGAGNDTLAGGTGSDSLSGGNGNDTFTFAAGTGLTSADTVNGGAGTDTVALTGNTAVAATNFDNVSNIEAITLGNTNTGVTITTKDGLVAAGAVLTLSNAANSGALIFNGSAETDGAFSITGGFGNDNITGGSGNDTFTFAATNLNSFDTVNGGSGSDTVALTGNTVVASTAFNNVSNIEAITLQNTTTNVAITTVDTLVASSATLTLDASSLTTGTLNFIGSAETNGAFSITGGAANDTLTGGTGADTLTGGDGNDSITGGAGVDVLDGGNGNDTFVYATSAAFVTGGAVVDSVTGGAGTDTVQIAGAISLATSDNLGTGRLSSVEQLAAASSGSNLAHSIVMNSNANLGSITTIDLSANTGATSTAVINMTGVTTAMTLTGVSAGHNVITGGDGNDTITGGSGNDTLTGGNGNDTFVFATTASLLNANTVYHTDYSTTHGSNTPTSGYTTHYNYNYYYHNSVGDIITGGGGTDQIQVGGAITIIGTTHYDGAIYSGYGVTSYYYSDDTLAGIAGVEQLVAASSSSNLAHSIVLGANADLGSITTIDLSPNTGASSTATIDLTGVTTAMTLTGVSAGPNNITGGAGADSITGGSGADSLVGGNGADTIIGGGGADTINLTETVQSTDTVTVNAGDSLVTGQDQIHNFNAVATAGQFDQLDLPSTTIAANGAVNGTDVSGILSHSVTNGMISFDNLNQTYTTPIVVNAGNVANVDAYLAANIASGQTVAFYVDANNNGIYTDATDYLQVFQGGATPIVVDIFTTSGLGGVTALGTAAAANTVVLV